MNDRECIFCQRAILPNADVKENEFGEFLCSPECEQQKAQADAEAAWQRRYNYDFWGL